ncbi:hypothetical protein AN218_16815, partial [Streptomyces nanshensis]
MSTLDLDFVGEPFDALALVDAAPHLPQAPPETASGGAHRPPATVSADPSGTLPAALRELRGATALAHEQLLRAHDALQRRALRRLDTAPAGPAP